MAQSSKEYLESQQVESTLASAVSLILKERPICATSRIAQILAAQAQTPVIPATPLKIFGIPISPNAASPILLAMHTKTGAMEAIDAMNGAHLTPDFLQMNPYHHLPTLLDGTYAIGESAAILRYISLKYAPEFYPVSDLQLCGRIDFALDAFTCEVYPTFKDVVYTHMGFGPPPSSQEDANKKFDDAINLWMKHFVQDGPFVGGARLTIADFKAAPFFFCALQPGLNKLKFALSEHKKVEAYCDQFCSAIGDAADFLRNCGGFSLAEFIASKAS